MPFQVLTAYVHTMENQNTRLSVTHFICEWNNGNHLALDELISLSYHRLHKCAKYALGYTQNNPSIQATELISELYFHFRNTPQYGHIRSSDFFAVASLKIRQILQDYFRYRSAAKRTPPDIENPNDSQPHEPELTLIEIISVRNALEKMKEIDSIAADIVVLRVFWEFNIKEVSSILEISESTISRHWKWAKSWLVMNHGHNCGK